MTCPLSRPMAVADLAETALDVNADTEEREALARHLGLVSLERLEAELLISPEDGMIGVLGTLHAELIQSCVLTLEPVESRIEASIQRHFGPDDREGAGDDDVELTLESADPPDSILDGVINLGAVVVEQLALEIDPFPKAPGANFDGFESAETGKEMGGGGFAALAGLKDKLAKKS